MLHVGLHASAASCDPVVEYVNHVTSGAPTPGLRGVDFGGTAKINRKQALVKILADYISCA